MTVQDVSIEHRRGWTGEATLTLLFEHERLGANFMFYHGLLSGQVSEDFTASGECVSYSAVWRYI